MKILVLQGESDRAEENELLGEFILTGLRRAPKGEVEIEVTFEISADGIVSVSAKDMETGLKQAITVTATSGLTEDEIRRMVEASKEYMLDQKQSEEFEKHKQAAEKLVEEIESLFPRVEQAIAGSDFGQDAVKKARSVVDRARAVDRGAGHAGGRRLHRGADAHPQHVQRRRRQDSRRVIRQAMAKGDPRAAAERIEKGIERYGDGDRWRPRSSSRRRCGCSPEHRERKPAISPWVKDVLAGTRGAARSRSSTRTRCGR